MSKGQNRWYRYVRLAFVALAFVLYPYFVNQIPALEKLLQDVPLAVICLGALVFAAIVVVGPELLNDEIASPEELWKAFLQKNQEIIEQRLKNALDQGCHIDVSSVASPDDLERPKPKTAYSSSLPEHSDPQVSPQKPWWRRFSRRVNLREVGLSLPLIGTRREVQNLQTAEVQEVAASKPILEIFQEANRRLLILGEPGSGKTTELLKLAQALGKAAKNNLEDPIPVIFELSAWRGEPMLDWMVGEMEARYGLKRQLCRKWLIHDRIVPLLDGLDELGGKRARDAILAIDALQEDYNEQQKALVICCRIADYESIEDEEKGRIRLRKIEQAVRLCELSDTQIEQYLKQRQATHLWEALQANSGLMALARNPMLLNLMPVAYADGIPENTAENREECQAQLFDAFLHQKLYPPKRIVSQPLADYEPQEALHYLAWLAAGMGREEINQREFLIEKLQPTWLENSKQRNQYRIIILLIISLLVISIFGFKFGLILVSIFVIFLVSEKMMILLN